MLTEGPDGSCKFLGERPIQSHYLISGLRTQLLHVRIYLFVHISSTLGKYSPHLGMRILNASRQLSRCRRKSLTRVPDAGLDLTR